MRSKFLFAGECILFSKKKQSFGSAFFLQILRSDGKMKEKKSKGKNDETEKDGDSFAFADALLAFHFLRWGNGENYHPRNGNG